MIGRGDSQYRGDGPGDTADAGQSVDSTGVTDPSAAPPAADVVAVIWGAADPAPEELPADSTSQTCRATRGRIGHGVSAPCRSGRLIRPLGLFVPVAHRARRHGVPHTETDRHQNTTGRQIRQKGAYGCW